MREILREIRDQIEAMAKRDCERTADVQASFCSFDVEERAGKLEHQFAEPVNPDRVIRFKASDATLDRYDEVILPEGWDLREYAKNPVVMQFHDYTSWPIGKAIAAGVKGKALYIDAEFDPPEVDESADLVFRKIKHGSVRAGSVGFIPLEYVNQGQDDDLFKKHPGARRIYKRQSLLEWTICPIPANPNALAASLREATAKRFEASAKSQPPTAGDLANEEAIRKAVERLDRIEKLLDGGE